jgi:hypothetical protein
MEIGTSMPARWGVTLITAWPQTHRQGLFFDRRANDIDGQLEMGLTLTSRACEMGKRSRRVSKIENRRRLRVPDSGADVIAGPISRVLAFAVLFAIGAVVTPARAQIVWNNTGTARCAG